MTDNAEFETVKRFGETFVVRRGINNILPVWEEIAGLKPAEAEEEPTCPDFLITNSDSDGEDGLYWTSWEECLAEYAVNAWGLNSNRMTEATLHIGRHDHEKNDVLDIMAAIVSKWGDSSTARILSQLGQADSHA